MHKSEGSRLWAEVTEVAHLWHMVCDGEGGSELGCSTTSCVECNGKNIFFKS